MDSDSHKVGTRFITFWRRRERNVGSRFIVHTHAVEYDQSRYVQVIAALFSLLLVIISLLLININSYATTADAMGFRRSTSTPTATGTTTSTATATDTPTPTATETDTPTPTATDADTPTPRATATQSITPTATATTAQSTPTSGTTPTSSASTPTPGATMTYSTTPTVSIGQSPTTTTGNPTTTTNSGGSDNTHNSLPPPSQSNWPSLSAVIIGLLVILGTVSAILIGLVVLRNRLLPRTTLKTNLPPSGAQPWKRVRNDSLNGFANNQNDFYASATIPGTPVYAPFSPMPSPMDNMFASTNTPDFSQQHNTPFNSNNNGVPSSQSWNNSTSTHSFSPSQAEFPPNGTLQPPMTSTNTSAHATNSISSVSTNILPVYGQVPFSSSTTGNQPLVQQSLESTSIAEQRKTTTRSRPTSVRLRAMPRNSSVIPGVPANLQHENTGSETVPSLDDPVLRDTWK